MRLFIAEKPSMGMEIAKVLANKNNKLLERSDGFISVGNDVVTWQFGHILELKSASEHSISACFYCTNFYYYFV